MSTQVVTPENLTTAAQVAKQVQARVTRSSAAKALKARRKLEDKLEESRLKREMQEFDFEYSS